MSKMNNPEIDERDVDYMNTISKTEVPTHGSLIQREPWGFEMCPEGIMVSIMITMVTTVIFAGTTILFR